MSISVLFEHTSRLFPVLMAFVYFVLLKDGYLSITQSSNIMNSWKQSVRLNKLLALYEQHSENPKWSDPFDQWLKAQRWGLERDLDTLIGILKKDGHLDSADQITLQGRVFLKKGGYVFTLIITWLKILGAVLVASAAFMTIIWYINDLMK